MNETLKKILKFISRSFGFLLINFSIILILFAFFINSSISNVDSLKNDLEDLLQEQALNQTGLQQVQEYCKNNQQDEKCIKLLQLEENQQFNNLFDNIKAAKNYINLTIFSSFLLFLFGFLFIYFGTFNLLITCYKISLHLTINNILVALYFNFIPNLINALLNNPQVQELLKEIPKEFIDKILTIILNWLKTPLFLTVKLTLILASIFLVISVVLFFLKKKALKDTVKD